MGLKKRDGSLFFEKTESQRVSGDTGGVYKPPQPSAHTGAYYKDLSREK